TAVDAPIFLESAVQDEVRAAVLNTVLNTVQGAAPAGVNRPASERIWWLAETHRRILALTALVRDFMPWLLPEFAPLHELSQMQGIAPTADTVYTGNAAAFAADLDARVSRA